MIKAVLFDLDGTLVNTMESNYNTYKTLAENRGLNFLSFEDFISFGGNFRNLEESAGIQNVTEDEFVDTYSQFLNLEQPFDDTLKILEKVKADGFKTGIATTASWRRINSLIEKFGLNGFFDSVVSTMDSMMHKPDPHSLIVLAENLGVKCEECTYIGDSISDVLAAKAAGMISIGITRGIKDSNHFDGAKPDAVFENLSEAYNFIKRDVIT